MKGQVFAEDPDYDARVPIDTRIALGTTSAPFRPVHEFEIDPDCVPREVLLDRPLKSFMDFFFINNGINVVSTRLREILERLDPGLHQFWPMNFRTKRGIRTDGQFHGMVVMGFANALSEEGSDLLVVGPSMTPLPGGKSVPSKRKAILRHTGNAAVRTDSLPACHLWWDHGLWPHYLLCSDALRQEIVDGGLNVFKMKKLRAAERSMEDVPC
ncbi:imm11 family protein [Roseicyclus salinarum]|uniref:imm11 family protein n=1 Tax=Roseicyclus salinarum TaxID=3036773 RepID=UPI00241547D2|nr:DUF1629 domain-containing protein [Roseibacterium sp. SDUM158017]